MSKHGGLSYAKGIYHINIEFIQNGSKISLSRKEHKQTTLSNVLYKTTSVIRQIVKHIIIHINSHYLDRQK